MSHQPFVLIVYGATGFTGQLVAEYLHTHPELAGKPWAIAGRTKSKLAALSAKLGGGPEVLCVDLGDASAVDAMVAQTSVVLNCAGPYSLNNGADLLGACARAGVHYSDLSGEGFFQSQMAEAFHETAKENGAKIILAGGVDSIPSDLGAMIAAQTLATKADQNVQIRGVYTRYTGSFSGGTLNSGLATAQAKKSGKYTDAMEANPYLVAPGVTGMETDAPGTADGMAPDFKWRFDWTHAVVSKFFMAPINARIVRRSLALRGEHQTTSYGECASLGMWLRLVGTWASRGFGYFVGQPINFKPASGEGPPPWLLRDGGFEVHVTAVSEAGSARTRVSGRGDPGYGATSKMLAELGLCLALDDHSGASHSAGVLTPSTGLGHALVSRLTQALGSKFMAFRTTS
ncbi:saccharopine dehydrogenase NADP-binding domain-containing protein [Alphaproteobacteria bacterium]|nr:saccharopine dehydrogenase NADP-binding domain-containing protein [Alphaproteobacteria bacterium]